MFGAIQHTTNLHHDVLRLTTERLFTPCKVSWVSTYRGLRNPSYTYTPVNLWASCIKQAAVWFVAVTPTFVQYERQRGCNWSSRFLKSVWFTTTFVLYESVIRKCSEWALIILGLHHFVKLLLVRYEGYNSTLVLQYSRGENKGKLLIHKALLMVFFALF